MTYTSIHFAFGYPEKLYYFFSFTASIFVCILIVDFALTFVSIVENTLKTWKFGFVSKFALIASSLWCIFICFFGLAFIAAGVISSDNAANFNWYVGWCYVLLPIMSPFMILPTYRSVTKAVRLSEELLASNQNQYDVGAENRAESQKAIIKRLKNFRFHVCLVQPLSFNLFATTLGLFILLDFPYAWVFYPSFLSGPCACGTTLTLLSLPPPPWMKKYFVNNNNKAINKTEASSSSSAKKKQQDLITVQAE